MRIMKFYRRYDLKALFYFIKLRCSRILGPFYAKNVRALLEFCKYAVQMIVFDFLTDFDFPADFDFRDDLFSS